MKSLYYAELSPPSRAVMLTAKAVGIELELKAIDLLKSEHLTDEFIQLNPQHTIPTLDDDGIIIYDSHAICSYLVEKYATDDKLYPKDLIERATVDARLHFDSGHLFSRLRFLCEPVIFKGSKDYSMDKIAYIQACYEIMENFLQKGPYLCGETLTIADYCCIATVTSCMGVASIDEYKFPKLWAWIKSFDEIPFYKEINEKGAKELTDLFKEKLAANRSKGK